MCSLISFLFYNFVLNYFCFSVITPNQYQKQIEHLIQAVVQFEAGQYVNIHLFDKDDASDDENLGR